MNTRKIIKKTIIGIAILFMVIVISVISISIIKKDEIIAFFIKEANKQISTPIDVKKIDISIFHHFPDISIDLKDVTIKESYNENKSTLATAKKISFAFSPFDLLNKNYTINGLHLSDAEINLKIDKNGEANYLILTSDSTSKGSFFSLNSIKGQNIKVNYLDIRSDYEVIFQINSAQSNISQNLKIMDVQVKGDLISDEIRVGKRKFLNNKVIEIETGLQIDLQSKLYEFKNCNFSIDRGQFALEGNINAADKNLKLNFKGVNTSFRTVNSLLSSDLAKYFMDYNSKGDVFFTGQVSGNYGERKKPNVTLEFGAKNASFFHPKYKKQIENVNLNGYFTTGRVNKPSNYNLEIKGFSCLLDDKTLEGHLLLHDFDNYQIDMVLQGEADVNSILLLFPDEYVKTAFGSIKLDVHLNGALKNPKFNKNFNADGEVDLRNISFVLTGKKLPFNKINGFLSLRNNDLAVSNLTGTVGNSDFSINGFFKDISGILLNKNAPVRLQADLRSDFIDFDELLKSNFASRDTLSQEKNQYAFRIAPEVSLDFNCEIQHLKFRRFNGRNIKGQLGINDQIAVLRNVAFSSMGGRINVSGSVNNKNVNLVETITEANLYNISIDSVFYVFKNFNQTWLIDKNLKGQLDADINLYMNFNKNLVLNSKSLTADIQTSIINGELNDFEPMMKLSKFVEEESLAQMRFSRMTNNIKIQNRIIYLPEMEIRSNVSNILVKGQHSFDRDIDYRFQVPLKNFLRISRKKDFEQSARYGMNLMLKITGTTSDYTVSYDTESLKESIKNDFKDEGEEWRNIKNRDYSEETPQLEDEYFDFETDSTEQQID